ncbi:uncharacterized protein LOC132645134 isoform X2 [Lycium barbarum]|uniref:uncharacterized protein LOC132645134 isoform X2 n=1 Tax=Lycium barbarum TaxID=112863 RepID=UPI00293E76EE|nr:uncharacterized protein LOC132645134 isoform X2 [Lycium barbarum]
MAEDPTFINVGCIAIDDGTRALESRLLEQDELIVREQQLHSAREEISQALYEIILICDCAINGSWLSFLVIKYQILTHIFCIYTSFEL